MGVAADRGGAAAAVTGPAGTEIDGVMLAGADENIFRIRVFGYFSVRFPLRFAASSQEFRPKKRFLFSSSAVSVFVLLTRR